MWALREEILPVVSCPFGAAGIFALERGASSACNASEIADDHVEHSA